MTFDQAAFDAGLDAYQARLYEEAAEAAERSHEVAARPEADAEHVYAADLEVGDFMTNEGPGGRWVKVIEIRTVGSEGDPDGWLDVLFEIPEPVHVSGETRYWIKLLPADRLWIDKAART